MRRKIKQALALLLAVASLIACIPAVMAAEDQTSGTVPVTITADSPTFSVTVPTTLPIHMDANGGITCGDITITNVGVGPVLVGDTQLTALNGWSLLDYASTTFTDANKGQHKAALRLDRDSGLTAAGKNTGEDIIPAHGGTQRISLSAKIPYQGVDAVDTSIAQIVFVLGWHQAIPAVSVSLDRTEIEARTETLTATVQNDDGSGVVWSSSDPENCSVSDSGNVEVRKSGTYIITATSVKDPSKSANCVVSYRWTPTPHPYDTGSFGYVGIFGNAVQGQFTGWPLWRTALDASDGSRVTAMSGGPLEYRKGQVTASVTSNGLDLPPGDVLQIILCVNGVEYEGVRDNDGFIFNITNDHGMVNNSYITIYIER